MPDDNDSVAKPSDSQAPMFREELFRELITFLETAYPAETTMYVLDNFNNACAEPGAQEYCEQEGIWMPPPDPEPDDDDLDDDEVPF